MLKRRSISSQRVSSRKGSTPLATPQPPATPPSLTLQQQQLLQQHQQHQSPEVIDDIQKLLSKLSSTATVVPLTNTAGAPTRQTTTTSTPTSPITNSPSSQQNQVPPPPPPPQPSTQFKLQQQQQQQKQPRPFQQQSKTSTLSDTTGISEQNELIGHTNGSLSRPRQSTLTGSKSHKVLPRTRTVTNDASHSQSLLTRQLSQPKLSLTTNQQHQNPTTNPNYNPQHAAKLTVRVPRSSLRNASGNGLAKRTAGGIFSAFSRSSSVTVSVQPSSEGRHDSVFYAPFPTINSNGSPALVDFLHVDSAISTTCVTTNHSFDVSFVGAYLPAGDYSPFVLYSVRKNENENDVEENTVLGLQNGEYPVIHFNKSGKLVNGRFMAVPTSTAVSVSRNNSNNQSNQNDKNNDCVSLRFSLRKADNSSGGCVLVEKDVAFRLAPDLNSYNKQDNNQRNSNQQQQVNGHANGHANDQPNEFEKQQQNPNGSNQQFVHHGETFLQYGYYFFLRDDIDAQLYAQTEASAQAVPLLLRRQPYDSRMALRGEKEYFPLTGVPYVVVRVSAASTSNNFNATNIKSQYNNKSDQHTNGTSDMASANRIWLKDVLCGEDESYVPTRNNNNSNHNNNSSRNNNYANNYNNDDDNDDSDTNDGRLGGMFSGGFGSGRSENGRKSHASSDQKRTKRKSMSSSMMKKKNRN